MLDSLDQLKVKHERYGTNDADFLTQVKDLENYMHFNKAPPMSTMADMPGALPY